MMKDMMGALYCLKVGWGDASVIITDKAAFLVDCHNIGDYANLLPVNKRIHGIFITHQHKDHFSGFEYLIKHKYSIDYLIYSPYKRRRNDNSVTFEEWTEFEAYKQYFINKGTKQCCPYRQINFEKPWWRINEISFWIIGPYSETADSETRELHDASLVITAQLGIRKVLFAGDASDASLELIANNTNNYCNDILHASHHGSLNGAQLEFIKKCTAEYTVISTESGVYPNSPDSTALKRYKDNTEKTVYRTDVDGPLKFTF